MTIGYRPDEEFERAVAEAEKTGRWEKIFQLHVLSSELSPDILFPRGVKTIRTNKDQSWESIAKWLEGSINNPQLLLQPPDLGILASATSEELFTIRLLAGICHLTNCQFILKVKEDDRVGWVNNACIYFDQIISELIKNEKNVTLAVIAVIELNLAQGLSKVAPKEEALIRFRKASEIIDSHSEKSPSLYQPIKGRIHYYMGRYLLELSDNEAAIKDLAVALHSFDKSNSENHYFDRIIAEIHGHLSHAYGNLPNFSEAKKHVQLSIHYFEGLAENKIVDKILSRLHNHAATACLELGEHKASIKHCKAGLKFYSKILPYERNEEFDHELACLNLKIGSSLIQTECFDEVAQHLDFAYHFFSNSRKLRHRTDARLYCLSIVLHRQSQYFFATDQHQTALDKNLESLTLFDELMSMSSVHDFRVYLEAIYYNFWINFRMSRFERSIIRLISAISTIVEYSKQQRERDQLETLLKCINTVNQVVPQLITSKHRSICLELMLQSLNIFSWLRQSSRYEHVYMYSAIESLCGYVLLQFNAMDDALNHFINCERLLDQIESSDLSQDQLETLRAARAENLHKGSLAFLATDNPNGAKRLLDTAIYILSQQNVAGTATDLFLAEVYSNMSNCCIKLGEFDEALNYADTAIRVSEQHLSQGLDTTKEVFAISHLRKAKTLRLKGSLNEARESYYKALKYICENRTAHIHSWLNIVYETVSFLNFTEAIHETIQLIDETWNRYKSMFSFATSLLDQQKDIEILCLIFRINVIALTRAAFQHSEPGPKREYLYRALSHAEFYRSWRTTFFIKNRNPDIPNAPVDVVRRFQTRRKAFMKACEAIHSSEANIVTHLQHSTFRSLRLSEVEDNTSHPRLRKNAYSESLWNETIEAEYSKSLEEIWKYDRDYVPYKGYNITPYADLLNVSDETGVLTVAFNWDGVNLFFATNTSVEHYTISVANLVTIAHAFDKFTRLFNEQTDPGSSEDNSELSFQNKIKSIEEAFSSLEGTSNILFGQLLKSIPERIKKIIISTDSTLSSLPLHALCIEPGSRLSDRYEIVYTSSLELYNYAHSKKIKNTGQVTIASNPLGDLSFCSIEGSIEWPDHRTVRAFFKDVTIDWVNNHIGDSYIFQYSGHARYDSENQLESSLVLSGGAALTARYCLENLHFNNCRLAILNGCATGTSLRSIDSKVTTLQSGLDSMNSEALSLSTTFLLMGAKCTFSTLWPVWDISSAIVNWKFSSFLKEGLSPATSLHKTIKWLRDEITSGMQLIEVILPEFLSDIDPEYASVAIQKIKQHALAHPNSPPFASPAYWAPYVISGSGWN